MTMSLILPSIMVEYYDCMTKSAMLNQALDNFTHDDSSPDKERGLGYNFSYSDYLYYFHKHS